MTDQCLRARVYANIREQFNWAFNQTTLQLTREIRKRLASVSLNHPLWNPQRGRVSANANSLSPHILWSAGRQGKKRMAGLGGTNDFAVQYFARAQGRALFAPSAMNDNEDNLGIYEKTWRERWEEIIILFLKRCHKEERPQKEEQGIMHLLPEGISWYYVRKKANSKGGLNSGETIS